MIEAEYPEQVQAFCQRYDAIGLLARAIHLAHALFPDVSRVTTEISQDPEEDSEWLVVRVFSSALPARLADAYRNYVEQWVQATPPGKRRLVRLSAGDLPKRTRR